MKVWLGLPLLTLLACSVNPGAYVGKECDTVHPCSAGYVCAGSAPSRCQASLRLPDGGLLLPDGGVSCVRWSQAANGFGPPTTTCSECSVAIDTANGNSLSVNVPGPGNSAYAPAQSLGGFAAHEGTLTGRWQHPSGVRMDNPTAFVRILSSGGTLLNLAVDNNLNLLVTSGAGTLTTSAVSSSAGPRLDGATFHTFDIRWREGAFRRVTVDGVLWADQPLAPKPPDLGAVPSALQLGIILYESGGSQGLSNLLNSWELCDKANVP